MTAFRLCLGIVVMVATAAISRADLIHADILLQSDGLRLVTGWYNDEDNSRGGPQRVFAADLLSTFDGDEPGVRAVASALPAGFSALPTSAAIFLDLRPMTLGATKSNLFYWNGVGAVDFTHVAAGTSLNVSGTGGFSVTADGTNTTQTSSNPFVTTSGTGTIHKHPEFVLSADGTPQEGFYLISLGFRAPSTSLLDADPAYLVFATSGSNEERHEDALMWVDANLAAVPEPTSMLLTGLCVGGIAYRRWRRGSDKMS